MRLTLSSFLTLDGVMQAPGQPDEDTSGGFRHGGWQVPYVDDELVGLIIDRFAMADAFLLGRRTYQIFASHWPQVTDPGNLIAQRLNTLPKYVASTTLGSLNWHNSTLLRGSLAEEVARLKRVPGEELQVHGSGRLAATLIELDLVDEYRLWFHPLMLGTGLRLFDSALPATLRLVDTRTTAAGVMVGTYHSAGRPTYGSFALDAK